MYIFLFLSGKLILRFFFMCVGKCFRDSRTDEMLNISYYTECAVVRAVFRGKQQGSVSHGGSFFKFSTLKYVCVLIFYIYIIYIQMFYSIICEHKSFHCNSFLN